MDYAGRAYGIFAENLKRSATTRACVFATVHRPATMKLMDLLEQTSQTGLSTLYDNPHLVNAVLYINKHYMDKLSVNDVAGTVGVSSRYLTRLFCEHLDMGVSTYITYVRISKAIEFKHANPHYPLTNLALDIGFGSQQHFSKVFKEKMGVSPKKYFSIGTALG